MVKPSIGSVILVHFPFSDLSKSKLRPALVLAPAGNDDYILCQITSNPWGDPLAVEISSDSFVKGGLPLTSYARPAKLFTASISLFVKEAGRIKEATLGKVIAQTIKVLCGTSLTENQNEKIHL
jgi:mRNA interferase MazF